jgi:sugar/nucleoside kinase (ribokinase family)
MQSTFENNGRELLAIFKGAVESGVSTSLDISLPDPTSPAGKADWPAIYRAVLPYVDIFVPSIEEAFFTLHPREYLARKAKQGGDELVDHFTAAEFSELADEFLDLGCKMVSLKAGQNGWYFKTAPSKVFARSTITSRIDPDSWAGRELWCPAFSVDRIASATGSGDTSIAAFLAALLRGSSIEESLAFANCAGAMNLSAMDASSGLRSWDDMRSFIARSSVRPVKQMPASGWKRDEKSRCWSRQDQTVYAPARNRS